jgi:RNA polymerase sigma-70 factor (sigma-E family)
MTAQAQSATARPQRRPADGFDQPARDPHNPRLSRQRRIEMCLPSRQPEPAEALRRPWLQSAPSPAGGATTADGDAMRAQPRQQDLERLVAERGDELMRAAVALAGSRDAGADLLQAALERLLRNWSRIETDPEGYLRRILYHLAADGWRRRGRGHRAFALLAAQARHCEPDPADAVSLRDAVARAMRQLSPRQRAVLLLRYWEGLSEAETAALLGCPEGTVKSSAARGLAKLRELTASWPEASPSRPAGAATQGERS